MRFCVFFIIFFLLGCSTRSQESPQERIVTIKNGEFLIGYGVKNDDNSILTATHVLKSCISSHCGFAKELIGKNISIHGDVTFISRERSHLITADSMPEVDLGDRVYVLKNINNSWNRYDTKITAINKDYIAYDEYMSGSYFTGAIEIDMAFLKGESGLPVWSLSGVLIGVVSATDENTGKSYVVR